MVKHITDHAWAIVLLLGLMTVSPVHAQKVGSCAVITGAGDQVDVLVNHRTLTGEELRLYIDTCDQIDVAFGKAGSHVDATILTMLLNNVDALPGSVDESSKSCLRSRIESNLERVVAPGDHLISDLVASD